MTAKTTEITSVDEKKCLAYINIPYIIIIVITIHIVVERDFLQRVDCARAAPNHRHPAALRQHTTVVTVSSLPIFGTVDHPGS